MTDLHMSLQNNSKNYKENFYEKLVTLQNKYSK